MNKKGFGAVAIIVIAILIGVITTLVVLLTPIGKDKSADTVSDDLGFFNPPIENSEDSEEEVLNETLEVNNTESDEINETVNFLDVSAHSLVLENGDCPDGSIPTCVMNIKATVKNTGTLTVDKKFVMHLFDSTNGFELLETFTINGAFSPESEQEFSYTYNNLSAGSYFVQFKVDAVFNLNEVNEDNNVITEFVKIF